MQPNIRALAFMKLEELLEEEYSNISPELDIDDQDLITKLECIIELLKLNQTERLRMYPSAQQYTSNKIV